MHLSPRLRRGRLHTEERTVSHKQVQAYFFYFSLGILQCLTASSEFFNFHTAVSVGSPHKVAPVFSI